MSNHLANGLPGLAVIGINLQDRLPVVVQQYFFNNIETSSRIGEQTERALMKIFLSWSGARSRTAAEVLKWWTRCVIQAARPWISTEDIDRGALWFSEINNGLSDTAIGIVCLTQENKDRPWILFEAGALAKGLSNSRVCTFLVDLDPSDIRDPLAQFNHTQPKEEDMRKLARTLNRQLGDHALDEAVLNDSFDAYWPQFELKWKAIEALPQVTEIVKRPADDIMSEILENVRGMNQRIRNLENIDDSPAKESIAPDQKLWVGFASDILGPKLRQRVLSGEGIDEELLAEAKAFGISPNRLSRMFHEIRIKMGPDFSLPAFPRSHTPKSEG